MTMEHLIATARRDRPADLLLRNGRMVNVHTGETLAWDIAREISKALHFEGEVIIDWNHYGYGYTHSYCLIFRKST